MAFGKQGSMGRGIGKQGQAYLGGVSGRTHFGQIATRTLVPGITSTANKQIQSRRYMYARDTITSLQVAIPNWYVNVLGTGAETGSGGTATVFVGIEDAAGNFTQITWGGAASTIIADAATGFSDTTALVAPIVKGSKFYVRAFVTASNGIVFTRPSNVLLSDTTGGDACEFAASGITNKTMGGTITPNGDKTIMFAPIVVAGATHYPSVYLLGDSRTAGTWDNVNNASGDLGELARSVGPTLAYTNGGLPSYRAVWAAASFTNQAAIINSYFTHVISNLGINDFNNGRTSANLVTDLNTIRALFSALKFYQTTQPPISTSTDSWATTANQTAFTGNTNRVTFIDALRAGTTGLTDLTGWYEVANVVESAQDSGKWTVNGTANYATQDGVHENNAMYLAIQSSGNIAVSGFTW